MPRDSLSWRGQRVALAPAANWSARPWPRSTPTGAARVGYYLWKFPVLTQTFVQREIDALHRAGKRITVFADVAGEPALLDAEARAFAEATHYLMPIDRQHLRAYLRRFLGHCPLTLANVLSFTVSHRYAAHKSRAEDFKIVRRVIYLAGQLQDRGVTHLHCPWADLSSFVGMLAARLADVSYSVQARASADLYRNRSRWALAEKLATAQFVVTGSEFNRLFLECVLPPDHAPIHVVYEGVNVRRLMPRSRHRLVGTPVRILSVGRMIEEKGFLFLLRALALLRERGHNVRCVIVGGADTERTAGYDQQVTALCSALKLQDCVRFAGALPFDQVLGEYQRADIFALPCVVARDGSRDVTPNALIEAMAMKLPVVATNMTAIPEIVEHRVTGILVPPRHHQALTDALTELITHPHLAAHLGEKARQSVEARFDIDRNIERYLRLFP
jgi:colanic acid/amylovoran biosynthesis glycosyltransferase